MKILVTGGCGFIGSNLCEALVAEKHDVFVIDNLSKQVHGNIIAIPAGVDFTCGDVSNPDTWRPFYGEHFDVLIHLAAETGTGQSAYEATRYCRTNMLSTAIINDLIVNNHMYVRKIILASSRAVYGEAKVNKVFNPLPSYETDRPNPKSIYAVTKLAQEQILSAHLSDKTTILRFQNVYGVGQSLKNPYTGIISIFSTLAKHNQPIKIFENGLMTRDFVYVDDVVNSIVFLMGKETAGGVYLGQKSTNRIYNVGTGIQTTVLDVANTIVEMMESKSKIVMTGLTREGDIRHNYASIAALKNAGFTPSISFQDGISRFVEWAKKTRTVADDSYEKSLAVLVKAKLLT